MKKLIFSVLIVSSSYALAQTGNVGINTRDPKTTFDINGLSGTDGKSLASDITGLQAPRLTLQELSLKGDNLYSSNQKGALIYITDISGGNALYQRTNIKSVGYYYFDGNYWLKLMTSADYNNIYNSNGSLVGLSYPGDLRTLNLNGYSMAFNGANEQTYWSPTGSLNQINNLDNGGLASFLLYGGNETLLSLQQFSGSYAQIYASNGSTGLVVGTNGTATSTSIIFSTSSGSHQSGTEKAKITGEGRMGIGEINPQATLHIRKTVNDLTPAIIEGCNEYADNAAAAAAGIPVGGLYRTGELLKIRY